MSTGKGGGNTVLSEINVTPMVDVMLVLLIIFMVTAPMINEAERDKREVELDLPVTRDNDNRVNPADIDKVILEITRDLKVMIGSEVLVDCSAQRDQTARERFEPCFATIETKLRNNAKLQADGQIYLLADTEIPYGFVVGTMARIRKAGVAKLGMITNPEYLSDDAAAETK